MKKLVTIALLMLLTAGVSFAQYSSIWEKSKLSNTLPSYFGSNNTERGFAYGKVGGNSRVYVVTRKSGNKVAILNAATGDSVGALSTPDTVIKGGNFPLNDIEVSEDGIIFGANMSVGAKAPSTSADTLFKVYKWTAENVIPVKVIEYNTKGAAAIRLGDKITVTGKASDNTLAIWAVQASGTKVVKFTTADNGATFTPSEITLSTAVGGSASIAPIGDGSTGFYINSGGNSAVQCNAAGTTVGTINGNLISTGSNAIRYFEIAGKKYIVTYNYGSGNENLRIVDVTDGAKNATKVYTTKALYSVANIGGTGDVAVKLNGTTANVFVLGTNNGMAAYRFFAPLTLAEARADANGADFLPDLKGDTVYVKGIVYTPSINKSGFSSYYISDGTAGIQLFSDKKTFNLSKGDSISVIGYIDYYYGMTEIVPIDTVTNGAVKLLKSGAVQPTPVELTLAQIKTEGEKYESSLVTVKNMSLASGTWPVAGKAASLKVTDGKDTLILYINKYTDLSQNTAPTFPQDITGMVTQNTSNPSNTGYQIYPRTIADFTAANLPVELTSFEAAVSSNNVNLKWATSTETNNSGFEVYRNGVKVAFVKGNGTTSEKKSYSYTDKNLSTGKYAYKLVQIDLDGTKKSVASTEANVNSLPTCYAMDQNYPNPFNPATTIKFALPADAKVTLKIFNVLGQQVAQLVNGNLSAGKHDVKFDASKLNSGIYIYSISAKAADGSQFSNTKKMMLLK
jgi:hypothetical protein